MSEDQKSESQPSDNKDSGSSGVQPKFNIVAEQQKAREAILAKHQAENSPVEEQPKSESGKEPEAEAEGKSEVGVQQSESVESEGKDNKSSVDKSQSKNEKPKGNLEKALQEEREKRKKANLEARQLREKYDAEMTALRKEFDELKRTKQDESAVEDNGDPEKVALKQALQKEREQREVENKKKQEEELVSKQKAYEDKVTSVHNELKEAGYSGFKFFQTQTREAILKRYNEGEFVDQDLNDPAIWKKVFTEDVYEAIKNEFPASKDKELLDKKLEAKKKAGGISNPGPAPKKEEEKPEPTMEELNQQYIKQRQEASRKVGA